MQAFAEADIRWGRPSLRQTFGEVDLRWGGPLPRQTFAEANLCQDGPLQRQTFAEADLCWGEPLLRWTFAEADFCRGRLLPRQTFVVADLCQQRPWPALTNSSTEIYSFFAHLDSYFQYTKCQGIPSATLTNSSKTCPSIKYFKGEPEFAIRIALALPGKKLWTKQKCFALVSCLFLCFKDL